MIFTIRLRCYRSALLRISTVIILLLVVSATFAVQRPSYNSSGGFFVFDGKVYDSNGTNFIAAGINNAHGWDDYVGDTKALNALPGIAGFGFNSVRVIWGGYGSEVSSWKCTTPEKLEILDQILQSCVTNKMVPMVGLWDGSGKGEPALVREMTKFWVDNKALIKKYEKYMWINIANEWGSTTYKSGECELWRDTYKEAITTIRAAGIKVPLVIDAPDWGHRIDCGSQYGQEIVNHDPLKSVIFSVHYYCPGWGGATATDIKRHMKEFSDKKLAFVVGEYGEQESCFGQIEKDTIVKYANAYGFGHYWFAWWCPYWSAASSYGAKTKGELTTDGKWLIYDNPYAIIKTAVPASIFGAAGPLAAISASPLFGSAPLAVTFDATASRGENLTYSWSFGDNTTGSGKIVTHTFLAKGNHTVKLKVTNTNGSNETSLTINVFPSGTCKLSGKVIGTEGSWNNSGDTRDKVFDGNVNTFFDSPSPSSSWAGLDLGQGKETRVTLIRFYPRNGYADRMAGGVFQGASSVAFSSPVELYRISSAPLQQWHEIEISQTTKFRYVRYLSSDNSSGNVAEIEFNGSCSPTATATQSTTAQVKSRIEGKVRVFTLQGKMVPSGTRTLTGAQIILLPDGKTVRNVSLGRTVDSRNQW